jgi:peptidoglycan/LPS O-acetylase OafA/YrhL
VGDTGERAPAGRAVGRPGGWLGGLDGLRAIAVTAVVVFHFLPATLPGGFLGVDLFFGISGFLITRLLLAEIDLHVSLSLRDF